MADQEETPEQKRERLQREFQRKWNEAMRGDFGDIFRTTRRPTASAILQKLKNRIGPYPDAIKGSDFNKDTGSTDPKKLQIANKFINQYNETLRAQGGAARRRAPSGVPPARTPDSDRLKQLGRESTTQRVGEKQQLIRDQLRTVQAQRERGRGGGRGGGRVAHAGGGQGHQIASFDQDVAQAIRRSLLPSSQHPGGEGTLFSPPFRGGRGGTVARAGGGQGRSDSNGFAYAAGSSPFHGGRRGRGGRGNYGGSVSFARRGGQGQQVDIRGFEPPFLVDQDRDLARAIQLSLRQLSKNQDRKPPARKLSIDDDRKPAARKDEDNCSLCLESLLDSPIVVLPCKHPFHKNCLETNQQTLSKQLTDIQSSRPPTRQPSEGEQEFMARLAQYSQKTLRADQLRRGLICPMCRKRYQILPGGKRIPKT